MRKRSVSPTLGVILLIIVSIAMVGSLGILILSLSKSTHSITFIITHSAKYNGTHYNWRGVIKSTGDGVITYSTWNLIDLNDLSIPIKSAENLVSLSFPNNTYVQGRAMLIVQVTIDGRNFFGQTPIGFADDSSLA